MRKGNGMRKGLYVAALLAAGSVLCLEALDGRERVGGGEKLYVPSGRFLREASFGFRELAADYLWLQTTQYYGGYRRGDHDLGYFRGMLENGVYVAPSQFEAGFLSTAHGEAEIQQTIDAAAEVMQALG